MEPNLGAKLLREAMASRGESQADVFRALGTESSVVSRWLSGSRSPARAFAARIAEVYGVPVDAWDKPVPSNDERSTSDSRTGEP